jgi:hypothetical protein
VTPMLPPLFEKQDRLNAGWAKQKQTRHQRHVMSWSGYRAVRPAEVRITDTDLDANLQSCRSLPRKVSLLSCRADATSRLRAAVHAGTREALGRRAPLASGLRASRANGAGTLNSAPRRAAVPKQCYRRCRWASATPDPDFR